MNNNKITEMINDLFILMPVIQKKVCTETANILKEKDLTLAHLKVLFYLMKYKEATVTEMANKFLILKPNMSKAVDSLVNLNYVKRKECADRRYVSLELTNEGKVFLRTYMSIMKDQFEDYCSELSEDDVDILTSSIHNIKTIMNKVKGENEIE